MFPSIGFATCSLEAMQHLASDYTIPHHHNASSTHITALHAFKRTSTALQQLCRVQQGGRQFIDSKHL
jgi:hypothetical protein